MAAAADRTTATAASTVTLVAAFAAIYVVWGSTFLAIRYAVETIPPLAMMAARCLVGGGILLAFGLLREPGGSWPSRREWGGALVVGAGLFVGCHGVLALEERHVASGTAALCLATIPLFVPLLAWWLPGGRRPSARTATALVVGLAGVVLLVAAQGGGTLAPVDAIVLVFAAFSWAAGTVATKVVPVPRSPVLGAATPLLAAGAILTIAAAALGELGTDTLGHVSARSVGGLAFLVVFGTALTFSAYVWLLRVVLPARVATYAFVNPVVAVLLGWSVAGEPLTLGALIATGIIVSAVAVAITDRPPRTAEA